MRSECLAAGTCSSRAASTASASLSRVGDEHDAASRSCSAWENEVGGDVGCIGLVVGEHAISVGPASASMPMRPLSRRLAAAT